MSDDTPAKQLERIDLYEPPDPVDVTIYRDSAAVYEAQKASMVDRAAAMESTPNRYDETGDFFEKAFYGNSTQFLRKELLFVADAFGRQYGSNFDECGAPLKHIVEVKKSIEDTAALLPRSRTQARFMLIAYLSQLHEFHQRVKNGCDRLRFEVFIRWVSDNIEKFIKQQTIPGSGGVPYFADMHEFVRLASIAYIECHDDGGQIEAFISTGQL